MTIPTGRHSRRNVLLLWILVFIALFAAVLLTRNDQESEPPATNIAPATPPAGTPPAAPAAAPPPIAYEHKPASPDGIGKFFHGREISHVMGHTGITWLERGEREAEEAPSRAIEKLDLRDDTIIADIGAGSGYHSFRIAPRIPNGRVIAVDIQQEMIDFLKNRAADLGITNVTPHLGSVDSVNLPPSSIDAALMVDAYHEFSHPAEMLASLHSALKPGGRIYLLEFRAEDPRVPIKPLHKMTEAQARTELEGAGFRFLANQRHLPWQHFLVFERP
jgi:SAM-dependent methyltransferase